MPTHPDDWYQFPINFSRTESQGSTAGLRSEITSKLALIQEVFRQQLNNKNYQINIRAGQEWNPKHGLFSLHHTGFAVDIRTRDLPGGGTGYIAQRIAAEIEAEIGAVVLRPSAPASRSAAYSRSVQPRDTGVKPRRLAEAESNGWGGLTLLRESLYYDSPSV